MEIDENSGTTVEGSEHLNFGAGVKYVIDFSGAVGFGAELMHHKFYWYSVRVPYVPQSIYRRYDVEATKLTPLIRIGPNSAVALDLGPELLFSDGLTVGLHLAGRLKIPLSQKISIPLGVKFEMYKGIVLTMPISLNAGIGIAW